MFAARIIALFSLSHLQEHVEDILSVDFIGPSTLASGSYDGEIIIWNTNSEHASRHMMQRSRRGLRSRSKSFAMSREVCVVDVFVSLFSRREVGMEASFTCV